MTRVFQVTIADSEDVYRDLEDFRTEIETAIGAGTSYPFDVIDIQDVTPNRLVSDPANKTADLDLDVLQGRLNGLRRRMSESWTTSEIQDLFYHQEILIDRLKKAEAEVEMRQLAHGDMLNKLLKAEARLASLERVRVAAEAFDMSSIKTVEESFARLCAALDAASEERP